MRILFSAFAIAAVLTANVAARADDDEEVKKDVKPAKKETHHFGVEVSGGVPNGAGLAFITRPSNWAYMTFGATYNGMAPGVFTGLTIDPIKHFVGITLTGELGASARGKLIGVPDAPEVSYVYANIHPGIVIGDRDRWRIFVRGGVSWLSGTIYNVDKWTGNKDNTLTFSNPQLNAAIAPTIKAGFIFLF